MYVGPLWGRETVSNRPFAKKKRKNRSSVQGYKPAKITRYKENTKEKKLLLPSIEIGLDISSVFEKGFNGDRTPLLQKSNGLGDVDSLDFLASLFLQPTTLLVPKIYIIQNSFKRLVTKVTKQADDVGSAGKLASLRNKGRGDPSIIS